MIVIVWYIFVRYSTVLLASCAGRWTANLYSTQLMYWTRMFLACVLKESLVCCIVDAAAAAIWVGFVSNQSESKRSAFAWMVRCHRAERMPDRLSLDYSNEWTGVPMRGNNTFQNVYAPSFFLHLAPLQLAAGGRGEMGQSTIV